MGDELELVLPRQSNPSAGEATGADGQVIHDKIVGIGVPATQVVPLSDLDGAPTLVAGPALVERYSPTTRAGVTTAPCWSWTETPTSTAS